MKVEATQKGYDGLQIREKGDVFEIRDEAFDSQWMKRLDGPPVEKPVEPVADEPKPVEPEAPVEPAHHGKIGKHKKG